MNDQELTDKLLATAYTKGDLLRRLGVMRSFLEQLYFTPKQLPLKEYLDQRKTSDGDAPALLGLGDQFFSAFNRENVYTMLDLMAKKVSNLPTVVVYLPGEIDSSESEKVGTWMRKNVRNDLLLDLKTDVTMVGGCGVVCEGIWHDLSLRYWMKKKQSQIIETIGKYVENP
jgi:hypothetical protein